MRIDLAQSERTDLLHRFRNYGEDLWALSRDQGRITMEFQVVDTPIDRFRFSAANEIMARRAVKTARESMSKHLLSGSVEIVEP